jgi:hypothetical protein
MQGPRESCCQKQQKKKSAGLRDQSGLLGLCQGASRRPLYTTFDEKNPGGNTHLIRFDGDHALSSTGQKYLREIRSKDGGESILPPH